MNLASAAVPQVITYTIVDSPLGLVLAAATERGLCMVGLGDDAAALEAELRADFLRAAPARDDAGMAWAAESLLAYLEGRGRCDELPVDAPGTPFQQRVWAALRAIPYGQTRTYGQIAEGLGMGRSAARAVGAACGANPVSLAIPCHRAVGSDGKLHGFRWSIARKERLLALERGVEWGTKLSHAPVSESVTGEPGSPTPLFPKV